jgi:hypothetical protein
MRWLLLLAEVLLLLAVCDKVTCTETARIMTDSDGSIHFYTGSNQSAEVRFNNVSLASLVNEAVLSRFEELDQSLSTLQARVDIIAASLTTDPSDTDKTSYALGGDTP